MELEKIERTVYSQNGEDGIIQHLLGIIPHPKTFLELGCGNGETNNTSYLASKGYKGVVVDQKHGNIANYIKIILDNKLSVIPIQEHLNLSTIRNVLSKVPFLRSLALLSLDIDSIDYWIMREILNLKIRPLVCVVEYNATLGKRPLTIPYASQYSHQVGKHFDFGCSITAWTRLFNQHGYKLATVDTSGINAFFIQDKFDPQIENARMWSDHSGFTARYGNAKKRWKRISHLEFYEVQE